MMNIDLTLRDSKKIIETINCVGNEVKKINSNPTQAIQTLHQRKERKRNVEGSDKRLVSRRIAIDCKLQTNCESQEKTAVTVIM